MLLSFAQFEREVTSERIRDKIAASKKKGLWMGGPVPLGYEVRERRLVVRQEDAEQVRHIMRRYLELGTVPSLVEELERTGYRTKVQQRTSGPHRGGCIYRRGTLYHLLSNRIYRGMIVHKGKAYPGEHEAIVEEGLWNKVQTRLQHNACGSSRRRKHQHPSLLIGKVFDGRGRAMTPSHAPRKTRRYRYYVTRPEEIDESRAWRVSAHDLEALVCQHLASRIGNESFVLELLEADAPEAECIVCALAKAGLVAAQVRCGSPHGRAELLGKMIERIDLHEDRVEIRIDGAGLASELELEAMSPDAELLHITVPAVRVQRGHQLRLVIPSKESAHSTTPRRDEKLVALIAEAHQAQQLALDYPGKSIAAIASEHGKCRTRLGKLVRLSCLAPDIVTAIVEGRQPEAFTANRLSMLELPLAWSEQRKAIGFI